LLVRGERDSGSRLSDAVAQGTTLPELCYDKIITDTSQLLFA